MYKRQAGGSLAGIFDNIYIVLAFRALVGIGVGIIMPLSTGLLSFYYSKDKQDKLMGYSSAMNQMGGVIATLVAGLLASVSWRLSFLVYLIGLLSVVLCLLFYLTTVSALNHGKKRRWSSQGITPVSYTHLDVYKRQGLIHPDVGDSVTVMISVPITIMSVLVMPALGCPALSSI